MHKIIPMHGFWKKMTLIATVQRPFFVKLHLRTGCSWRNYNSKIQCVSVARNKRKVDAVGHVPWKCTSARKVLFSWILISLRQKSGLQARDSVLTLPGAQQIFCGTDLELSVPGFGFWQTFVSYSVQFPSSLLRVLKAMWTIIYPFYKEILCSSVE